VRVRARVSDRFEVVDARTVPEHRREMRVIAYKRRPCVCAQLVSKCIATVNHQSPAALVYADRIP
jgi:hypothetical protein